MKVDQMVSSLAYPMCTRCKTKILGSVKVGSDADGDIYRGQCPQHGWLNWQAEAPEVQEPEPDYPLAITREEFRRRVVEEYGDPGLYAAESMCLEAGDYQLGYEHCADRIAPALEEELACDGGDPPADPFGEESEEEPEAVLDQFIIR